jgi:hypothetical protein
MVTNWVILVTKRKKAAEGIAVSGREALEGGRR